MPPVTIPSWPCIFSGLNVEELGFYWFDHPTKGLFNSNYWREKSIFSINELRQFVLNVPGTYPAWNINGEMISGMMSPSLSCFPAELSFFLKNNWIIDGKSISESFNAFKIKSALFKSRLKEDYDLLTYVIRLPDSISHHSHLNRELLNNYIYLGYKKIDKFLGELLKDRSIDNIFIFSDHGLKFFNYEFNISRWFEKKNLLFINNINQGKIYSIIAKFYDYLRPIIKVDYEKYKIIKKKFLKKALNDEVFKNKKVSKTRVMAFFGGAGALYLNQQQKVKMPLILDALNEESRITKVRVSNVEGYPDIFILLDDKFIFNQNPSFFLTRRRNTISHTPVGFFLAYGNDIANKDSEMIRYQDIAPTILNSFNLNKQNHMSGETLNIFNK